MTNTLLYLLPIISAFTGWLISRLGISLFFKRLQAQQKTLAMQAGSYVAAGFSFDEIAAKLTSKEAIEKILPVAEEHIDHFLRVKLPAAMPMLTMFISDKLVADMKAIFMAELKELFPTIINQYLSNATSAIAIDKIVANRLEAIDINKVKYALRSELNKIAFFGALIGFVTGGIQIFLTRIA
ncbi:hypothetical protein FC093_15925 [Ilyomonas limi]|uniref:DUF445 family protein n=1 Tax=Ilyomonas limi TaxID=2575867 RepID=A0A4U3KWM6_9BACT|nr:hypothetical protein [Ilyomonas limi]TKK66985.1 hypothetical protein FC093_15925 [Ilyomonas limi]